MRYVIQMVMRCVTCVRYDVRVNGELTDPMVPSRFIRQGDPIILYFIFSYALKVCHV
jgi:cytochrome oxidase Cu insertion factor (SCO1/SenC/PrrC family)